MSPAYYDGPSEVLYRDENGSFTGAKLLRNSPKILIVSQSIADVAFDYWSEGHPFEIDFSDAQHPHYREFYAQKKSKAIEWGKAHGYLK